MDSAKLKQKWLLKVGFGLLLLVFGCSMGVYIFLASDVGLAKTAYVYVFVIIYGLSLIFSKPPKDALEIEKVLRSPLIQDERVVSFYQTTLTTWSNGKLASLGNGYKNEAIGKPLADFIKSYPPYKGSALRIFFDDFQPLKGEFLVGLGNIENIANSGWFVLTNIRLIQRDGRNNEFKEIALANIDSYQSKSGNPLTLALKMKSGEEITFEKLQLHPKDELLTKLISQSIVVTVAEKVTLTPEEEEEADRKRIGKYGIKVVMCPSCNTINSESYVKCIKCSASLVKEKPIRNPYL